MGEKDKRIAELEALLKLAYDEIKDLKAEIAMLKQIVASLKKNSGNSSKPPSSDIIKPPKKQKNNQKQKIGAQKGHKQHHRKPFNETEVDKTIILKLETCPVCGGELQTTNEVPKIHQQIELVDKPFIITEFQQLIYWCENCQCFHTAELPMDIKKSGLFGPKLIALVAYLKGRGHMSYKTIQEFLSDALKVKVSIGFLAKQVFKASKAITVPYQELLDQLPQEKHLHIDETGAKENGKKRWIWCFRGKEITVFHVDPSRGSGVLENLLGKDYAGIISSDFWGAYRKFSRFGLVALQFCWAHLIRELKFLAESSASHVSSYGERILLAIKMMFLTIHRRDQISERNWVRRMERHRQMILWEVRQYIPSDKNAKNIAERVWTWQDEYFRFIHAGIPPTNNLGEQSIRRVVIDRKVTQGTRSDWGNRWLERFWSVLSTCEQRDVNVMTFLKSCVDSYHHGHTPPSILEN